MSDQTTFRWKLIALAAAAVIVCILGFRYARTKLPIVEYEDVIQYKLDVNPRTSIPEKVSGITGSALCVWDTKIEREGSKAIILISVGPCVGKRSGSFSIPLDITDDIKEVRFGKKEYLLWSQ